MLSTACTIAISMAGAYALASMIHTIRTYAPAVRKLLKGE